MIELHTPALLFPAVSVLMLAYTNRYLALGAIIRKLHSDYIQGHETRVRDQIRILRSRMALIRQMQLIGVVSLLLCMASMLSRLVGLISVSTVLFGAAVVGMTLSLIQCLREILRSGGALNILLRDLEEAEDRRDGKDIETTAGNPPRM